MKIGFALIVKEELLYKIIDIENRLHFKCNFMNKLGKDFNLPHITIFQGEFKDDLNYQSIAIHLVDKYNEILLNHPIFFENVQYVEKGWYFWMCEKSKELSLLSNYSLDLLKDSIIFSKNRLDDVSKFSLTEQEAIKKYGYRYAGNAYMPHITIGRANDFDKETLSILNDEFKKIEHSSLIDRITVYKMGENGTHSETLFEYKLNN